MDADPAKAGDQRAARVAERVDLTRICMIIGIVYLHCPPYVPIAEVPPGVFNFVKALVQDGLFRATVPVLTLISGYLYFRRFAPDQWVGTVRKKVSSLVVPMVFWNCVLLAEYHATRWFVPTLEIGRDIVWWNAIFSLTDQPINYPTWFLRDLFALAAIGVIFDQALRYAPLAGLITVAAVFLLDVDGNLVLNGGMAVNFYMGGWIARGRADVFSLDRLCLPGLLLWLGASALWVHLGIENLTLLHLTMPYCIWPVMAALQRTAVAPALLRIAPFSFAIFLLHAPFLAATWAVYRVIDPSQAVYFLFWFFAPLVAVAGAAVTRIIIVAISPALAGLVFGNR